MLGHSPGRKLKVGRTDRLLVLAPHPDDEVLAGAALLGRAARCHAAVRVAFVTSGENNPWPQRLLERRWEIDASGRARWGERREREALGALGSLGVPRESAGFHRFADQGLTPLLLSGSDELVDRIADEVSAFRPTHIVSPSPRDRHPDHSALGVAVRLALVRAKTFARAPLLLDYVIHGPSPLSATSERYSLLLDPEERKEKREAILHHASQLALRRSFCLGFVSEREEFFAATVAGAPLHPVSQPRRKADAWVFTIIAHPLLDRLFPPTLWLLLAEEGELRGSFSIHLTERTGSLAVRDAGTRERVAVAHTAMGDGRRVLVLPRSVFPPGGTAFVKLTRRLGFFDPDGWLQITALESEPETGGPKHPFGLPANETRGDATRAAAQGRRSSMHGRRPAPSLLHGPFWWRGGGRAGSSWFSKRSRGSGPASVRSTAIRMGECDR